MASIGRLARMKGARKQYALGNKPTSRHTGTRARTKNRAKERKPAGSACYARLGFGSEDPLNNVLPAGHRAWIAMMESSCIAERSQLDMLERPWICSWRVCTLGGERLYYKKVQA